MTVFTNLSRSVKRPNASLISKGAERERNNMRRRKNALLIYLFNYDIFYISMPLDMSKLVCGCVSPILTGMETVEL